MTRYAYSASSNWLNSADSTVRDRYLDSARSLAENAADQAERSVKAVGYAGRHELNILRREGEGWMEKAQERVGRTGGGGSDGGWPKTEKKDWQSFKPLVLKSQQRAHAAQAGAQRAGSGTGGENSHMLDGFYAISHRQHGRSTGLSSSSTGRGRGGEGGGESWVDELKQHPGDMAAIALADAALVTAGYGIGKHWEKKKSRTRSRSRSRRGTGVYQPDF